MRPVSCEMKSRTYRASTGQDTRVPPASPNRAEALAHSRTQIHPVYQFEVCKNKSLSGCKVSDDSVWVTPGPVAQPYGRGDRRKQLTPRLGNRGRVRLDGS